MRNQINDIAIFENHVVMHKGYEKILKILNNKYNTHQLSTKSTGIELTGDTGDGKSTVIKQFYAINGHDQYVEGEGWVKPIIHMEVPENPVRKDFIVSLLEKMGAPAGTERESIPTKTKRLLKLLEECKTRAIILEEFQHFIKSGTDKEIMRTGDWLKTFMNNSKILLLISGSNVSQQILKTNKELARRCSAVLRMRRFDWEIEDDRNDFVSVLDSFIEKLEDMGYTFPAMDRERFVPIMFMATNGRICHLKQLFLNCIEDCITEKRHSIFWSDLEDAWEFSLSVEYEGQNNPFTNIDQEWLIPATVLASNSVRREHEK